MNKNIIIVISSLCIFTYSCTDIGAPCEENIDCMGICNGDIHEDCSGVCGGDAIVVNSVCTNISYANTIQNIFNTYCAGCHINGSSGGLNLSEYDLNINYNSVFDRINLTNNNIMPPLSSESLPQSKIQLINQWINEGALDN